MKPIRLTIDKIYEVTKKSPKGKEAIPRMEREEEIFDLTFRVGDRVYDKITGIGGTIIEGVKRSYAIQVSRKEGD